MKALVFGVRPDSDAYASAQNETDPLLRGLAQVPMQLQEVPDARPLFPDWVVVKPRLTGICGSDAARLVRRTPAQDKVPAFGALVAPLVHQFNSYALLCPHRGQVKPSGQRHVARYCWQASSVAKSV